jgi:hypothetical protein
MAEMRLSRITYPDGTEKFVVEEVRTHSWGRSIHPVMIGSRFAPVTLTREQIEKAL